MNHSIEKKLLLLQFCTRVGVKLITTGSIPGIPPTGITLHIPFVAIVNIRGDRLYHEHITWDQATVLRQLGLLPEYLPFPYEVRGYEGKKLEVKVPVAGMETARKLQDQRSVESNTLIIPPQASLREVKSSRDI